MELVQPADDELEQLQRGSIVAVRDTMLLLSAHSRLRHARVRLRARLLHGLGLTPVSSTIRCNRPSCCCLDPAPDADAPDFCPRDSGRRGRQEQGINHIFLLLIVGSLLCPKLLYRLQPCLSLVLAAAVASAFASASAVSVTVSALAFAPAFVSSTAQSQSEP